MGVARIGIGVGVGIGQLTLRLGEWGPGLRYELLRASHSKKNVSDWFRGEWWGSHGKVLGASIGPHCVSARKPGGILEFGIEACNWAEGTTGKLRNEIALGMVIASSNVEGAIGQVQLIPGLEEWGPRALQKLSRASQSKNRVSV